MGNTCLRLYFLHLSCSLQMLSVMKVKHMVSASYFVLCGFVKKKNLSRFLSSVKNFAWRTCGKIFLEAIFKSFFTKFPSLFYVIALAKKISYFLSANQSSEL